MAKTTDIVERTVAQLVTAIDTGAGRYEMPWQQVEADILWPTNAATGACYTGGNHWLLVGARGVRS